MESVRQGWGGGGGQRSGEVTSLCQLEIPKISNPNSTRSANSIWERLICQPMLIGTQEKLSTLVKSIHFFPPLILLVTGHIMNINRAEIATRILTRQNRGVSCRQQMCLAGPISSGSASAGDITELVSASAPSTPT